MVELVAQRLDVHRTPDSSRTARIEARIAPDALTVVRRAAEIQGRSLNYTPRNFVLAVVANIILEGIGLTQKSSEQTDFEAPDADSLTACRV